MELIIERVGMLIYVFGAFIIVYPGVSYLEQYHKPGRLLRALEELEADGIDGDHYGFEEMKEEINSIVDKQDHLGENVHKLDVRAGTISTEKGPLLKIRAHTEEKKTRKIEKPLFVKIRYRLDRVIRRGKTKIRTLGIGLILVGFTLQMWPELMRVFSEIL